MDKTKIIAEPGKQELFIEREFDAPRDLVFKAFTDPAIYHLWVGPRRYSMIIKKFEPWTGGSFRFINRGRNGQEFAFHGVYHEALWPERLIGTFEFEGLSEKGHVELDTTRFEFLPDGKTKLITQAVYQSAADRDAMIKSGMEKGVKEGYERLDDLLAEMIKDLMSRKQFIVSRVFTAPKERVFKAWTEPKEIREWWGPKGFTAPEIKVDLRPGGKYLYAMKDQAGKLYWSGGEFKKVDAPEKLALVDYFTDGTGQKVGPEAYGLDKNFPKESSVTVTFKEKKGQTTLNISYDLPEAKSARIAMIKSGLAEGWQTSLDKLQALLEKA